MESERNGLKMGISTSEILKMGYLRGEEYSRMK